MKIENKEFWEKKDIIATQKLKYASGFELYMFKEAQDRFSTLGKMDAVKIFGCGSGREVKAVADFFIPKEILASDISQNMIQQCKENVSTWGLDAIVSTKVSNATQIETPKVHFQLVTILNSMLTYVSEKRDRDSIFKNSYSLLQNNGVIIGTVHNQVGTFAKTSYFKLRNLLSLFLKDRVGNRTTGFNGYKVPGYYYAKNQLALDLKTSGFSDIEIRSLEEFEILEGRTYDRKKGYNNLIFIASKIN